MHSSLSWRDLMILRCLIELTAAHHAPPTQRDVGRCLNALIERERIPDTFGLPIIPDNASKHIARLRLLGLVADGLPLTATKAGRHLNAQLPAEWDKVPTYLPFVDGKPDFTRARPTSAAI